MESKIKSMIVAEKKKTVMDAQQKALSQSIQIDIELRGSAMTKT